MRRLFALFSALSLLACLALTGIRARERMALQRFLDSLGGNGTIHDSYASVHVLDATVPFPLAIAATALLPLLWIAFRSYEGIQAGRARGATLRGVCPVCGYDLRATPDRCPECGHVPTSTIATPQTRSRSD